MTAPGSDGRVLAALVLLAMGLLVSCGSSGAGSAQSTACPAGQIHCASCAGEGFCSAACPNVACPASEEAGADATVDAAGGGCPSSSPTYCADCSGAGFCVSGACPAITCPASDGGNRAALGCPDGQAFFANTCGRSYCAPSSSVVTSADSDSGIVVDVCPDEAGSCAASLASYCQSSCGAPPQPACVQKCNSSVSYCPGCAGGHGLCVRGGCPGIFCPPINDAGLLECDDTTTCQSTSPCTAVDGLCCSRELGCWPRPCQPRPCTTNADCLGQAAVFDCVARPSCPAGLVPYAYGCVPPDASTSGSLYVDAGQPGSLECMPRPCKRTTDCGSAGYCLGGYCYETPGICPLNGTGNGR
jgi:hypothetical protein